MATKTKKCLSIGCRNRIKSRNFCATCRSRKRREADPVKYSWQNKKDRAKQRKSKRFPDGIPFTLSLEFFREWCYKVDYIKGAGRTKDCYDCDRIIETEGYHEWNIQKLLKLENIGKYHKHKRLSYDWQHKTATVIITEVKPKSDEDF